MRRTCESEVGDHFANTILFACTRRRLATLRAGERTETVVFVSERQCARGAGGRRGRSDRTHTHTHTHIDTQTTEARRTGLLLPSRLFCKSCAYSVVRSVAVCCSSVLQFVAGCCSASGSVLQCVAVCCSDSESSTSKAVRHVFTT